MEDNMTEKKVYYGVVIKKWWVVSFYSYVHSTKKINKMTQCDNTAVFINNRVFCIYYCIPDKAYQIPSLNKSSPSINLGNDSTLKFIWLLPQVRYMILFLNSTLITEKHSSLHTPKYSNYFRNLTCTCWLLFIELNIFLFSQSIWYFYPLYTCDSSFLLEASSSSSLFTSLPNPKTLRLILVPPSFFSSS